MTSYASVDRIEQKYIVCEVEEIPISQSNPEDYSTKTTVMVDVPMELVLQTTEEVQEGDILIVEYSDGLIISVYGKDEDEKERRSQILKSIFEQQ